MSDTENGAAKSAPAADAAATGQQATGQQPQQLTMRVLGQFIRDMSFENIVAQKGVQGSEVQPDIQVQVSLDAKGRQTANQYEVTCKFKIQSRNKANNDPLFLMELEYGGIFHIDGVPQEQMHPFLLIECPRMLFPFIRRIVSDVTRDGGFPALNLDNVDFLALYRQEIARRQSEQKSDTPVS